MEEEKPNYYAVIPAEVRYNKKLNSSQKLFYSEITSLTHKTGECWASNNYFARLYEVSPSTISNWVKTLEKEQFISVEYVKKGNEIEKRIIKITGIQNIDYVFNKLDGGSQNIEEGYSKNLKENNTSINNINNNNKEINKERKENIESVVRYLNLTLGTKYRATTQSIVKHINARFEEGYTLDDFFDVIENKYAEWYGTEMEKYLRPDTLFGTKFDIYLNQTQCKGKN